MASTIFSLAKILLLALLLSCSESVLLPGIFETCPADQQEPWSYSGLNGPIFWGRVNRTCSNGRSQSPIALNRIAAQENGNIELGFQNYNIPIATARIENDGHTVQITPQDGQQRSISVDGATYNLSQLHFHWGDNARRGSEHSIDGKFYAMEMHLVHQNGNGNIAVVGIFFNEQHDNNSELQKIVDVFPEVQYKNDSSQLSSSVNLENLLPNSRAFYRYEGSLTTPPCTEGVTWSVLPKAIPVGKKQMNEFRKLYSVTRENENANCKLVNNYRPIQQRNGRPVYFSKN